jgi:hypothetical protein
MKNLEKKIWEKPSVTKLSVKKFTQTGKNNGAAETALRPDAPGPS